MGRPHGTGHNRTAGVVGATNMSPLRETIMKPGMILVLVGVGLVICALMDVFGMSQGINLDLGFKKFSEWPPERWGLLGAGVGTAILGAWSLKGRSR